MSKLRAISWQALVKKLRKLGFEGPYQEGRHLYMVRDTVVLTIPNPHEGDISVDLLKRILRQAGISRKEWLG
jgi:predicted RNA binding protein YcfA (HicA-like mRNA interferase family)